MIRLMADTWLDAVMRPVAMAAPNGWVYTEIMAPDFRFVFALALALAALVAFARGKRKPAARRPVFVLLVLTFVSFVPWMATTGNGRYFMPYLILIGPVCIGLVSVLPSTRSMKVSIVLILLGVQGFALYQNNPWRPFDSWTSIPWIDQPYFSVVLDPLELDANATYISVGNMSLSVAAPQFPASSRWVNLSIFNGADVSRDSSIYQPVRDLLQSSQSLKLFQRSAPRAMVPGTDQPNQKAIAAINVYLQPHRLALKEPTDCKLLISKSLIHDTFMGTDESAQEKERIKSKAGFWICSLKYPVASAKTAKPTDDELIGTQVFEKMEALCPRFFPPGQELILQHSAGFARNYAQSDSSLIVTLDGKLYVKNARALNPELIGSVIEILKPSFEFDCTKFKGRSGLPWDREI